MGLFLLNRQVADLGAIAVGDYQTVSGLDQRDQITAGQLQVFHLLLSSAGLAVAQDGVAAESNDDCFGVFRGLGLAHKTAR